MFYSERLPKASASAAQARRMIDQLDGELPEDVLANARLLVSELVSNAVEHVSEDGEIELRVALRDDVLRVEVTDPGPGFAPRPRDARSQKDSGWGCTSSPAWPIAGRPTSTAAPASGSSSPALRFR